MSMNTSESILNPTHRLDAMNEKKALVCESCTFSNFLIKYVEALFARIVATPLSDSLIIAYIGDRAKLSRRLSSRELVTNTRRTITK